MTTTDVPLFDLRPTTPEIDRIAQMLYNETRPHGSPESWPNAATQHWRDVATSITATA